MQDASHPLVTCVLVFCCQFLAAQTHSNLEPGDLDQSLSPAPAYSCLAVIPVHPVPNLVPSKMGEQIAG